MLWKILTRVLENSDSKSFFSVNSRGPKQTVICYKCQNNRVERKEAIMELVQTEINYGNDFKIVKEVTEDLV